MRNIHVLRTLLFVFLAALLNTGASAGAGAFHILGAGTAQCGEYLDDRRTGDEDRTASIYYTSWVAGFLTAWNARTNFSEQVDPHRLKNETTIVAYLDKYCRDNPLGKVIEGTVCLMSDLGYKMSCHRDSEKESKSKLW